MRQLRRGWKPRPFKTGAKSESFRGLLDRFAGVGFGCGRFATGADLGIRPYTEGWLRQADQGVRLTLAGYFGVPLGR
jgi:hypothetical protein